MFGSLQDFLAELERLGELHRVTAEVDPRLEVAAITDRVSKTPGGKALLFERVKGGDMPVATNLFGSPGRMATALGVESLDDLTGRMEALLALVPPDRFSRGLAALPDMEEFRRFLPVAVAWGACQEVVEDPPDLALYPFLHCWPGDGKPDADGRFITLPLVFTRDPESGIPNCGMYRVRVFDGRRVGIRWGAGRGGELHCQKYHGRGERMPVAVALGGDPAAILAATLPLPETVDEMQFSGWLRGAPMELVRCRTSELLVPAAAEMVIEGYVEPGETALDGAFGNHTGFYAPPAEVPVLRVTCVTRRRDCIYPATVVGQPPMEDCFMAKAAERLFVPLLRQRWPDIVDVNLPLEWIFHGGAIVAVREPEPGRVRQLVGELWASGMLGTARLVVAVDGDTDVRDLGQVAWRVMNATDWRSDLFVEQGSGTPPLPWLGARLGIDATRKERFRSVTEELAMDGDIGRLVEARWREYGFR
ncbi:MAG: UbiD family decarboxylase [Desulfuromonadales bacterium]|nr:MAG: UbiD family decarboxylase [Desulfuromonadales bacterium]